ncbi:MAG: SH3 domain-containing protein [Pseudomonadota bacterium]
MRALLFLVLFSGMASVAHSDSLPAFYDVAGIEQEDVLNIRAAPELSSRILSTLPHNATNLEIVALDTNGEWGQIIFEESNGWVSLKFLARQAGQPDDELPRPLACFGNEPFWNLTLPMGEPAKITRMDAEPILVDTLDPVTSANQTDRYAVFGQGEEQVFTFIFHRDQCSDQMSDRAFGMSVDVFMTEESGVSYVTGCCNLIP